MAGIIELIRVEDNGALSFGNHLMEKKKKISDFEVGADIYKVKTFADFTKLEKNGNLLYESNPGTTVHELAQKDGGLYFYVEGDDEASITVELEAETNYNIYIDDRISGTVLSSVAGKLSFSVDFDGEAKKISIEKEQN